MWTFLGQSGEVPLITVAACYDDLKSLIYEQVNVMAVRVPTTNTTLKKRVLIKGMRKVCFLRQIKNAEFWNLEVEESC